VGSRGLQYPETAQEWLRNGSRNGRGTLEPVTSASPIGHPLSWEVPLLSDGGPRRAGPAVARVPEWQFPPRLYHAPCARVACTRARPCVRKSRVAPCAGAREASKGYTKLFLTHNFRIQLPSRYIACALDACAAAVGTEKPAWHHPK
jgi:hypothetical protein